MGTQSAIYSALGQDTRLAVVRALADAGDAGLPAGELSSLLSVQPSLLTAHLTVLRKAGIVEHERSGKFVVYRLARPVLQEAAATLMEMLGTSEP